MHKYANIQKKNKIIQKFAQKVNKIYKLRQKAI